jgi:hypothetical protein
MATIWARRRPIRDGVEPSNERSGRMSQVLPRQRENHPANKGRGLKMLTPDQPVEGATKITTRLSSSPDRQ